MAGSLQVRGEFRQLHAASRAATEGKMSVDQLIDFLTTMARLSSVTPPQKTLVPYSIVRI